MSASTNVFSRSGWLSLRQMEVTLSLRYRLPPRSSPWHPQPSPVSPSPPEIADGSGASRSWLTDAPRQLAGVCHRPPERSAARTKVPVLPALPQIAPLGLPSPSGRRQPEERSLGDTSQKVPAPRHSWGEPCPRLRPHPPLQPAFPGVFSLGEICFQLGPFALAAAPAWEALPPGVCQAGPSSPSAPWGRGAGGACLGDPV